MPGVGGKTGLASDRLRVENRRPSCSRCAQDGLGSASIDRRTANSSSTPDVRNKISNLHQFVELFHKIVQRNINCCDAIIALSYGAIKKGFKLVAQREGAISTTGIRAMKAIAFIGVVGLVGVVALGAAAQGSSGSQQTAKETECNSQADARDFWHSRI